MRFPAPIALPLLAAGLAAAAGGARAASLAVPLNHSVKLPVAGRAASVVVGNSKVADVTVVDSRTLFVTGKSMGSTDVQVVDPLGRTIFASEVEVVVNSGVPVTVFRGSERADIACAPRCGTTARPKTFGSVIDDMMTARMAGAAASPSSTPDVSGAASLATNTSSGLASGPLGGLPLPVRQQ